MFNQVKASLKKIEGSFAKVTAGSAYELGCNPPSAMVDFVV